MLGLARNLTLDLSCPNFAAHKQGSCENHPITRENLCSLLQRQLARSLDEDCECLDTQGLFGHIGVLFKITLTEYGYTFAAKGVQKANEYDLDHEFNVYSHLSSLQGRNIAVCLGRIALERPYPLVSMAKITKMMLMSWAGKSLQFNTWPGNIDIKQKTNQTLEALARSGVRHNDIRQSNLVVNLEVQGVMAVDFDQATIITSSSKRKASALELDLLNRYKKRNIPARSSHGLRLIS